MKTFERYLIASNRWALIFLLATMSVIIFVNVVMRYATDASLEWAEEVARYLMIWLTFLGAGPVLRYGGHIAVENLQDALPGKVAVAVRVLVAALLLVFFCFMVWYGWLYMQRTMHQMTPVTQIPFAWVYSAMPIGGLLLIAHYLLVLRAYLTERRFASDDCFDANASASL